MEQKENTPDQEVFENIISNKEELRKVCLNLVEKGYMSAWDYTKFCEANNLLIF